MTRRKLVAGNWKMFGSRAALSELDGIEAAAKAAPGVDVAVAVPFTLIEHAAKHGLSIGAQDVHAAAEGAHTGCVSAAMLVEAGASFVIVGHSERRADQHETDADVKAKAAAAHGAGLDVILCVGETEAERDAGEAERVVAGQITAALPDRAEGSWLTLAYEPRWAIGTGRTPTLEEIAAIHAVARRTLAGLIGDAAEGVRVLYGGSVNAGNAADILGLADVDGALVGGASLTAAKFVPIIQAA